MKTRKRILSVVLSLLMLASAVAVGAAGFPVEAADGALLTLTVKSMFGSEETVLTGRTGDTVDIVPLTDESFSENGGTWVFSRWRYNLASGIGSITDAGSYETAYTFGNVNAELYAEYDYTPGESEDPSATVYALKVLKDPRDTGIPQVAYGRQGESVNIATTKEYVFSYTTDKFVFRTWNFRGYAFGEIKNVNAFETSYTFGYGCDTVVAEYEWEVIYVIDPPPIDPPPIDPPTLSTLTVYLSPFACEPQVYYGCAGEEITIRPTEEAEFQSGTDRYVFACWDSPEPLCGEIADAGSYETTYKFGGGDDVLFAEYDHFTEYSVDPLRTYSISSDPFFDADYLIPCITCKTGDVIRIRPPFPESVEYQGTEWRFYKWEFDGAPSGTIADVYSYETTFTVGSSDAKLIAVYNPVIVEDIHEDPVDPPVVPPAGGENVCAYCSQVHDSSFSGRFTALLHRLLNVFSKLFSWIK